MISKHRVEININGVVSEYDIEPRLLLSDFIREDLGLTGTHVGCEHGICGACTILFNGEAARSCLMFAVQADGGHVQTIEGLSKAGDLSVLQNKFSEHHALQCGFCTAGMLIVAHDLLRSQGELSQSDVREGMSASLCRCTGYEGIVKAVTAAASERTHPLPANSFRGETR